MKCKLQFLFFIILFLLSACDSEIIPDCFKEAGAIISYEVEVPEFSSINVGEGIEVIVKEAAERKLVVQTGENFIDKITIEVTGSELVLRNNIACNWTKGYTATKVYINTPQLQKIYSASQYAIRSDGVLTFPELLLQSGMYGETASGSFELEVACGLLTIEDNQSIYCNITGTTENLSVNFYSGDARFDGADLIAQQVNIYHRSSNDIIVNPQQQVTGTIASTGNLVLVNQPPVVQVGQLYTGSLQYW